MRQVSEDVLWMPFVAGAVDAHGNPIESWGDPVTKGIYALDPGSTSEPREGQDRVIVEPAVYMPADVIFGSRDLVIARGKAYTVEGVTRDWRHPRLGRIGNVATLRRVEG
ncbi:MAG: hypothetical protein BGN97_00250 [Microbacterium sp. 69-10]|uniref:hypothetical protein n=1 Tax=Microbacterium sp. 69-10 TaxID=1895783 RepID=UPI00096444FC|nr:hypothetical protein [Microbacterium sp. 69-10]OJU39686.1 MAG: hypothetical protein BGN97_00250 [Microbacterium sp. 69-10]